MEDLEEWRRRFKEAREGSPEILSEFVLNAPASVPLSQWEADERCKALVSRIAAGLWESYRGEKDVTD